jgi:uncharacterized membrane protein
MEGNMRRFWAVALLQSVVTVELCRAASFSSLGASPYGSDTDYYISHVTNEGGVFGGVITTGVGNFLGSPFKWTKDNGFHRNESLQGYNFTFSQDGQTIAGSTADSGFRYRSDTGLQMLPGVPGKTKLGMGAFGISGDGNVVVGDFGYEVSPGLTDRAAFRWTQGTNTQLIATGSDVCCSYAQDVSANGSVVVGQRGVLDDDGIRIYSEAFSWNNGHTVGIGHFGANAEGDRDSYATAVSSNGLVVIGNSTSSAGNRPFRWTEQGGLQEIGAVAGSFASDISGDGSVIVGENDGAAFIWRNSSGLKPLHEVLADECGLQTQMQGWQLSEAVAVSENGRFIAGYGTNPSGVADAWIADVTCSIQELVHGNVSAIPFNIPAGQTEPKAVEIKFQPKCNGTPITLAEAAQIGNYTHFNWFNIVRSAPEGGPFPKADGMKNPTGQPHGGWDSSPLYGEEEPSGKDPRYVIGHPYNTPDEYTLRFEDNPAYSPLLWDGDPPMSFVTILVGIKGPLNKWDFLSGWEWTSTNRGFIGGVEPPTKIFELGNLEPIFLDEGGIAGIREITEADMQIDVRGLLIQLGGQNITIPGDFNTDGIVDAHDLLKWQGDFGRNAGSDADVDGDSDGTDFLVWQRNMGIRIDRFTTGHASVPEPCTLVLLAASFAALNRGRGDLGRTYSRHHAGNRWHSRKAGRRALKTCGPLCPWRLPTATSSKIKSMPNRGF